MRWSGVDSHDLRVKPGTRSGRAGVLDGADGEAIVTGWDVLVDEDDTGKDEEDYGKGELGGTSRCLLSMAFLTSHRTVVGMGMVAAGNDIILCFGG